MNIYSSAYECNDTCLWLQEIEALDASAHLLIREVWEVVRTWSVACMLCLLGIVLCKRHNVYNYKKSAITSPESCECSGDLFVYLFPNPGG